MLVPIPEPLATLAEAEIAIPALVTKYAEAIGEPVTVLPALERRTAALFVKNEPWERVMALAGESAGFRIVRVREALRLEMTRRFDLESLQRDAAARLAQYKSAPRDARSAFPEYLSVDAAVDRERERRPRDPDRLAVLIKRREALLGASSPYRLVLARFLSRGGVLPLGRTVLVRFGEYVSAPEFAAYNLGEQKPPTPRFAAFRLNDSEVEVALDPDSVANTVYDDPEPLPLRRDDGPEGAEARRALAAVPWTKVPLPSGDATGHYRIGDVLGHIHRVTGRPAIGVAPRVALPAFDRNLVDALRTGPVRVVVRDGAFLATSHYGDGLWPHDLKPLEELKSPTLMSVAAICATASPIWEALHSHQYGIIATPYDPTFRSGLSVLRFLGSATPAGLARLRAEGKVAISSLDAGTASAAWRYMTENAPPLTAIRRATRGSTAISMRFSEAKVTFYLTATGLETSIDDSMIAAYPDKVREVVRSLSPEFVLTASGLSDRVEVQVGDEESDVRHVGISRVTGEKVELKR